MRVIFYQEINESLLEICTDANGALDSKIKKVREKTISGVFVMTDEIDKQSKIIENL